MLGGATNDARVLANEPGNVLTPRVFAERAQALAPNVGLEVGVLDEAAIKDARHGPDHGRRAGQRRAAAAADARPHPPGVTTGPVLGLVGKGITFDTGGISIKPADAWTG